VSKLKEQVCVIILNRASAVKISHARVMVEWVAACDRESKGFLLNSQSELGHLD
jgi:hypothetical protein